MVANLRECEIALPFLRLIDDDILTKSYHWIMLMIEKIK